MLQVLLWEMPGLLTAKQWFSKTTWYELHNASVNEEFLLRSLLLFANPFICGNMGRASVWNMRLTFCLAVPPVCWMIRTSLFIFLRDSFSYSKISTMILLEGVWWGMLSSCQHNYSYFSYKINLFLIKQMSTVDPFPWMPVPGHWHQQTSAAGA